MINLLRLIKAEKTFKENKFLESKLRTKFIDKIVNFNANIAQAVKFLAPC